MAVRKQLFHPDRVREKIQASQLVNVLRDHATGKLDQHKCPSCEHEWGQEVSQSRVKAAEILLKKAMPDLSSVEMTQHEDIPAEGTVLERVEKVLNGQPGLQLAIWKQLTLKVLSTPVTETPRVLKGHEDLTGELTKERSEDRSEGLEGRSEGRLEPILSAHVSLKRMLLARLQAEMQPSEVVVEAQSA